MVKKTLLSLAIAATAAGLAGCNVSSTDKYDNKITSNPPTAAEMPVATSATYPIFDPANSKVPLGIDFLFGINSQLEEGEPGKDGTANTADTTPPVTTAINKLDGFSTVAPIYIDFNNELDPASVNAGKSVILLKMLNAEDNPAIDSLDLAKIAKAGNGIPVKGMVPDTDFEARYVAYTPDGMNSQHAIQILFKKPLEPKTKYMVILTNNIRDVGGERIGQSADYSLLLGNQVLPSRSLDGARTLVKTWTGFASKALGEYASELGLPADTVSAFNYTFTTTGTKDVLHAMAAPGTFLEAKVKAQLPTVDAAEAALSAALGADAEATLDFIAAQVVDGAELSGIDRDGVKETPDLAAAYYGALIQQVTKAQAAPVATVIDAPKSRTFAPLMQNATTPVKVSYDAFLTVQITPKVQAAVNEAVEDQITSIAVGEGAITQSVIDGGGDVAEASAQLDAVANAVAVQVNAANANADGWTDLPTTGSTARTLLKDTEALQPFYLAGLRKAIADAQVPDQVAAQLALLSSKGTIYQGGLQIPNYLPEAEAGKADNELGNWVASDAAAQALGLAGAPRDRNESANVTYRFPFAQKLGDNVIPVFATLPATSECGPKPADGWPVAIYQHGITVDRTAGVLVGNALAKACVAMVAIDHAMHGVGPTSATGLVFNVNTIAADAVKSPFAVARLGAVAASDFFANLKERHNNVGKNTAQENVTMAFAAAGAAADVGASGDLYINLQDFARTRDGMRQTVLDLMNLAASIDNMDINADGAADDLDPANLYFIGHSLGGIIGTTFVAVNNDPKVQAYSGKSATNPTGVPAVKAAVLGNAGGGVVKLLENSPAIGALIILPGLKAKAGLEQGSANLEKFFGVFQATIDSADPINFAGAEHMQNLPILSYTAVGDLVVPNNALGQVKYNVEFNLEKEAFEVVDFEAGAVPTAKSYLSGTDPLVDALGITTVINSDDGGVRSGTRFSVRTAANKADHGTFSSASSTTEGISEADGQATFAEIFGQIGSFLSPYTPLIAPLSGIAVQDTSVLEQAN